MSLYEDRSEVTASVIMGLGLIVGLLLSLAVIKFVMVASNFMHLKFDDRLLTRVFYAGLFLAVGVYLVVLATLHVFQS